MKFLGKNLVREREKAEFTQLELGLECNPHISPTMICRWETDNGKPSFNHLVSIKEALRCSYEDLIDGPVGNEQI